MEALERLEALSVCLSVTLSHGLSVHLSLCMGPFQEGSAALAAQAWDVAAKRQVHTPSGSPGSDVLCCAVLGSIAWDFHFGRVSSARADVMQCSDQFRHF